MHGKLLLPRQDITQYLAKRKTTVRLIKSAQNKVLRTLGTSLLKALTANVMHTSNVTYRGVKRLLLQAPCSHTACCFVMPHSLFQYCSKPSA